MGETMERTNINEMRAEADDVEVVEVVDERGPSFNFNSSSVVEVAGRFVMQRHDSDLAEIKKLFEKYSENIDSWCEE